MKSAIDADEFRRVLGHFASGVTVVTACHGGEFYGATVTAFCSVSLDPPLVLVCLAREAASARTILESESFAVNMLSEEAASLSRHFAAKTADKLAGVDHVVGVCGAPLLDDSVAVVECTVWQVHPAGDHLVVVGKVVAAAVREGRRPLLHYQGGYARLDPMS